MDTGSKRFWQKIRWDICPCVLVALLLAYVIGYSCDQSCADWEYSSDLLLVDTGMSDEQIRIHLARRSRILPVILWI